jgi:hypothetical protein
MRNSKYHRPNYKGPVRKGGTPVGPQGLRDDTSAGPRGFDKKTIEGFGLVVEQLEYQAPRGDVQHCRPCRKAFPSQSALDQHLHDAKRHNKVPRNTKEEDDTEAEDRPWKCTSCDMSFRLPRSL